MYRDRVFDIQYGTNDAAWSAKHAGLAGGDQKLGLNYFTIRASGSADGAYRAKGRLLDERRWQLVLILEQLP